MLHLVLCACSVSVVFHVIIASSWNSMMIQTFGYLQECAFTVRRTMHGHSSHTTYLYEAHSCSPQLQALCLLSYSA